MIDLEGTLSVGEITGGGTVEEVIHDNTLIGKGTSESPLRVDQSQFAKPSDLTTKQDTLVSGTNIKTINNQSLLGSGNINTGTYSKPNDGIPKSDLASSVQSSLNKADTALQTEQYTGTYSKPSGGIPKTDLASAVQTSLSKADTALQSYTEQYTGTITGITMNGVSKGTSGVVDLGTVVTEHQDLTAYELKPTTVSSSETTASITPQNNTIYQFGELTSLTIANPPATGAYSIVFTSGSTATTTVVPSTMLGLESFAAEANTIYEINVLDNRAVVGSWAVSV